MRRSSLSRKGQWFIVAAVVATGVFLAISVVFKSFSATDASHAATGNEEFYFWSVQSALNDVLANAPAGCDNLTKAVNEYKAFAERRVGELGYYLFLNVTLDRAGNCASRTARTGILLASEKMVLHSGVNPEDVLPGISDS